MPCMWSFQQGLACDEPPGDVCSSSELRQAQRTRGGQSPGQSGPQVKEGGSTGSSLLIHQGSWRRGWGQQEEVQSSVGLV